MKVSQKNAETGERLYVKNLIPQIIGHGGSFMFWRLPDSNEKKLIVCNSGAVGQDEISLEDSKPGFAFAPFDPKQNKFFFNADLIFRFKGHELIEGPDIANTKYTAQVDHTTPNNKTPKLFYYKSESPNKSLDYRGIVEEGINQIENGSIEKIVPSKFEDIKLPDYFDVLKTFYRLCEKHPKAFVSLVSSPETGTWLGASPELLVSVEGEQFSTIALAGTLPYHSGSDLKSVAWTQKEIEEQALVCRYIINCFKKIRVREYAEHGPRTVVAGSLLHLRTDYGVDMKEVNFPQLGSVMLKLLHPTSAVCGMPLEPAMDFLQTHEGYDREFYSGYLGPVNFDRASKLFVNLRCMQLFQKTARIYAGAGVTADSDPLKEAEEVDMKIETLSRLVNP
jgi:isochorismate synthase